MTDLFDDCSLLAHVRSERPLIHCITNYVTAGDVANMVLAAGASPVMADGIREAEEITARSRGLVLNIGTLKESAVEAMILAGKLAAKLKHPVIFDPVGAGASAFRTETAERIVKEVPCTVIRGNASEIRILAGKTVSSAGTERGGDLAYSNGPENSGGVDADARDQLSKANLADYAAMLKAFAVRTGAVVVMTGAVDMIADAEQICLVRNGHPMMANITGTGCMMDGIIAAFLAAGRMDQSLLFRRTAYAAAAAGLCGEIAYRKTMASGGGTGSFRMHFIDAMSCLSDADIKGGADIEV